MRIQRSFAGLEIKYFEFQYCLFEGASEVEVHSWITRGSRLFCINAGYKRYRKSSEMAG